MDLHIFITKSILATLLIILYLIQFKNCSQVGWEVSETRKNNNKRTICDKARYLFQIIIAYQLNRTREFGSSLSIHEIYFD